MRRLAVLITALLVLAAPAAGATQKRSVLQQMLDGLVEDGVPGAILLIRDGKQTVHLTSGVARISTKEPMRFQDRFRVGSLTKSFVASVVLQLVGEGKLSLADPVERWLPGVVPNGGAITLRQLLNHTSGIYNYTDDPRLFAPFLAGDYLRVWAPRDLVAIAVSHPPLFKPGFSWSYSNTNFILLGLVVEKATGLPAEQALRERVFEPLGLDATSFPTGPDLPAPYAHGYGTVGLKNSGPLRDFTRIDPSWAWSAGAIVSTVDDIADFYRALFRGELVTRHLVWRLESTVNVDGTTGYGLGVAKTPLPCSIVWGHDGRVPGYLTFALSSGSGRRQVVLSLNSDAIDARLGASVGQLLGAAYCGLPS